jgi:hypothetical protein
MGAKRLGKHMAIVGPEPISNKLVERIKRILFAPEAEWARIEAEPATIKALFTGYACILAAIGPVAQLIGGQLFGYHALWLSYHPPLLSAILGAIVNYLLALGGIFVLAIVIDELAPQFGGQKDRIQAIKLAIYAWTAAWLAGIFQLVPQVSALGIIGVYSLYLLYLGVPKLMKAPQDKALVYSIIAVVVAIVVWVVIMAVSAAVVGAGAAVATATPV